MRLSTPLMAVSGLAWYNLSELFEVASKTCCSKGVRKTWMQFACLGCIFLWEIHLFLHSLSFWTLFPSSLFLEENKEEWLRTFSSISCSWGSMTHIWTILNNFEHFWKRNHRHCWSNCKAISKSCKCFWLFGWHFPKDEENKEKEQEQRNSQNIGLSSSFWTLPMKELQKGKCNQVAC